MSERNLSDEEIAEFAEDLLGTLEGIQEAVEASIPKVEALLNDEISLEEYEEWVRANEELLNQMDY